MKNLRYLWKVFRRGELLEVRLYMYVHGWVIPTEQVGRYRRREDYAQSLARDFEPVAWPFREPADLEEVWV